MLVTSDLSLPFARAKFLLHKPRRSVVRMRAVTPTIKILVFVAGVLLLDRLPAQEVAAPPPGFVRLNLNGETPLRVLIDYVSERLQIQFLYPAELGSRSIDIRAPNQIPIGSLMPLLGSALKTANLVMVDAEIPGWKKIVDVKELPKVSRPGDPQQVLDQQGAATPVTQAFVLEHMDVQQLATLVRPLITQASANLIAIVESNVIVVTDYAPTVLTIEKLIKLVDRPRGQVEFEFYNVKHMVATTLAEQVKSMLGPRAAATEAAAATALQSDGEVLPDKRTNQIAVVGPRRFVDEAKQLLQRLDVSLGLSTQVYRFQFVPAERFDRIARGFFAAQEIDRLYNATIDEEGNLLIVQATSEIHARIDELSKQLDIPVKEKENPIQFYKLKNANAQEVLFTLLTLQQLTSTAPAGSGLLNSLGGGPFPGASPYLQGGAAFGGFAPTPLGGQVLPGTMNRVPLGQDARQPATGMNQPLQLPLQPSDGPLGSYERIQQSRAGRLSGMTGGLGGLGLSSNVATLPGGARVSADIATNSLVVYAPPDIQQMYKRLIDSLDRRRPQVLIEAEIVAVDTSDNFRMGVEVSAGDRIGPRRLFEFTSFGLSEVDPTTGALAIRPNLGFNGTLVDADVADVVVQALASHTRAKVLAAPRIIVNDNVEGQLKSVVSVPFQSVNASQTVSTTSLGGVQEAGTTITVTPHINEDDNLLLEFSVEFSSFSATGNADLPPPRQIDSVESVVTIPDGHTVIVGGLRRVSDSGSTTGVPFVEKIPILRELTSLNTNANTTTSFFLFIRPVILRDDLFADLRLVSDQALREAERPGQFPPSQPLLIE